MRRLSYSANVSCSATTSFFSLRWGQSRVSRFSRPAADGVLGSPGIPTSSFFFVPPYNEDPSPVAWPREFFFRPVWRVEFTLSPPPWGFPCRTFGEPEAAERLSPSAKVASSYSLRKDTLGSLLFMSHITIPPSSARLVCLPSARPFSLFRQPILVTRSAAPRGTSSSRSVGLHSPSLIFLETPLFPSRPYTHPCSSRIRCIAQDPA